jgi:RNA polymerase sigma factor (sigma-70 family)
MHNQIENYITKNYYELLNIARSITKGHELSKDLLHEVILQLYDKNEIKLKTYDDNSIKYYITAVMRINWNSKTSPFYYKIRRETFRYVDLNDILEYPTNEQEQFEQEQILVILEESWADLNWFHKSLFEMYMCVGSMNKLSKKTKIPLSSIRRYIKEAKEEIKVQFTLRTKNN